MERYYHIAGINICIKGNADDFCQNDYRLSAFRGERKRPCYNYKFSIVENLTDNRGECIFCGPARRVFRDGTKKIHYIGSVQEGLENAYIRCEFDDTEVSIQVKRESLPDRITNKLVLNSMNIEGLALKNRAFVLHASFIDVNGQAILFTAPSGTGKSTQAELWKRFRNAEIINGDRVAVGVGENNVTAWGIPFAGSSQYCKNAKLPIAAIVCLAQSEKTVIEPLRGIQAFRKILKEITVPVWEEGAMEQISKMMLTVLENVPVYHLACTPDESAVAALENVLKQKGVNEYEK